MIALSRIEAEVFKASPLVFDLLDDWTRHYAFSTLRNEVDLAYRKMFANAEFVTANSEATAELATRYGRSDVLMIPNGCDPERFSKESRAEGPPTVGYVGKIGRRLDLDAIVRASKMNPTVEFLFAGPVLDRSYGAELRRLENVQLLGDIHYRRVPDLLAKFDLGWVPHSVGTFEVGGDVIKTYEYRASHLPVLTTPILGAGSRLDEGIYVVDAAEHAEWIAAAFSDRGPDDRLPRVVGKIPEKATWQHKAREILGLMGKGDEVVVSE